MTTQTATQTPILTGDAIALLTHLHRGGAWAYWWTLPGKQSIWWRVGTPTPIPTAAHVYFAVHPVGAIPTTNANGEATPQTALRSRVDLITAVNCLFAEFDAKHFAGGKPAALAHVDALAWRPTAIIDSGGGYHCYWLLADTFFLSTAAERARADTLQKAWVKLVGSDDGAKDLVRVLRVPGTRNCKPEYGPDFPTVTVIRYDADLLYTFEALEAAIPTNGHTPTPETTTGGPDRQRYTPAENVTWARGLLARLSPARWDNRADWINIGFALCDLGAEGLTMWRKWSQQSAKYNDAEIDAKWRGFDPNKPGNKITLGSLSAWADTDTPRPFNLTDLGNAERIAQRHGQDLRYCEDWGKWLAWDGRRWARDKASEVYRRSKDTVRAIYGEAGSESNDKERKAISDHARQSESGKRIREMIGLAQGELPVTADALDRDGWLLTCANGTINLRTGELRPHRRGDLITKLAPVEYDPAARCDVWRAMLERILPDDDVRAYFQKAVGYSLTADVSEQVLFFCYGTGANGKSTTLKAIMETLGEYAKQAAPQLLMAGERHPTEIADMAGARLIASIEVGEGKRMAEALVKQMTGGDRQKGRFMRQDFFEFDPTAKIFLLANHKPVIQGTDNAIWRRIRLLPFTVTIPDDEQDKQLLDKLRGELPGILHWCVEGCIKWQAEGLSAPDKVRIATEAYRAEMDVVRAFLDDRCIIGETATVRAKDLYAAYKTWCEGSGETAKSSTWFGEHMTAKFDKMKDRAGWYYIGLGLVSVTT